VKYLGIICLVLVLAMGVIGVGYSRYTQDLTVNATVTFGDWNAADFSSIDVSGASDCTLVSQAEKTFTIKYLSKDNNRHPYTGAIVCQVTNSGTIPVIIDTVQVTVTGPDRDPLSTNLKASSGGALLESDHIRVDAGQTIDAGVSISGNPYKGDYLITVSFTTKVFTE
jgi:hypothetical protein